MATELIKMYLEIIPSTKEIKGSIQKSLEEEAEGAGAAAGGKLAGAIKKAISVENIGKALGAIGQALGAVLKEGADFEQSLGVTETVFKGSADRVKANAQEAYRTVGMSATQYMEMATNFGDSLLQSLGGDTQKAADISDMALRDMADNANKMGTDMNQITDAYQGFAEHNYTMLENLKLGYGGTQTEMERLLKDAEAITGIKYDINNLSDVYSAIHVIQGELGITGTTAQEASSTLSGSFSAMASAFQNVLGNLALGKDVGPSLNALAETVSTFLMGNLLPAIWNIFKALPGALITFVMALGPQIGEAISGIFSQLGDGDNIFQTANDLIGKLWLGIQTNLPLLLNQGLEILTNIMNGILSGIPTIITGAASVIMNLLNAFYLAMPQLLQAGGQLLLNLANGIINNLPQIIGAAVQAILGLITTIYQNYPQILQCGISLIGQLANGLIWAIPTIIGKIPQIIQSIINVFIGTDWGAIGQNIISGIAKGLSAAGSALWNTVKGVLGNFKEKVLSFFGIHSPSRWGIYIGEMIDYGIAGGLDQGRNAIARAVQNVQDEVKSPISGNSDFYMDEYSRTFSKGGETDLIMTIQELTDMLRSGNERPVEISVMLKDREVLRVLREMGVVFA